jgi:uncharacterized phage infection (PIP) family protein YhgE
MRIGSLLSRSSAVIATFVLLSSGFDVYKQVNEPSKSTSKTDNVEIKPQSQVNVQKINPPTKVIALINEDAGGEFNQKHYMLGDSFLQELMSNSDYEWFPTTRSVGEAAIRKGDIDALVIVNQGFTTDILNLNTKSPTPAKISFTINSGLSEQTKLDVNTDLQNYFARFNQNATRMYLSTILSSFQDSKWLVDDQLAQLEQVSQILKSGVNQQLELLPNQFKQVSDRIAHVPKQEVSKREQALEEILENLQTQVSRLNASQRSESEKIPTDLNQLTQAHEATIAEFQSALTAVINQATENQNSSRESYQASYQALVNQNQEGIKEIEAHYKKLLEGYDTGISSYEVALKSYEVALESYEADQQVIRDTIESLTGLSMPDTSAVANLETQIELLQQALTKLNRLEDVADQHIINGQPFEKAIRDRISTIPENVASLVEIGQEAGEITDQQAQTLAVFINLVRSLNLPLGPAIDVSIEEPKEEPKEDDLVNQSDNEEQLSSDVSESGAQDEEGTLTEENSTDKPEVEEASPAEAEVDVPVQEEENLPQFPDIDYIGIAMQLTEAVTLIRDYYGKPDDALLVFSERFLKDSTAETASLKAIGNQKLVDWIGQDYFEDIETASKQVREFDLVSEALHAMISDWQESLSTSNQEIDEVKSLVGTLKVQKRLIQDEVYKPVKTLPEPDQIIVDGPNHEALPIMVGEVADGYHQQLQEVIETLQAGHMTILSQLQLHDVPLPTESKIENDEEFEDLDEEFEQTDKTLKALSNQVSLVESQLSQQHDNLGLYRQNFSDQLTYSQNGGQDNLDYLDFLARPIEFEETKIASTKSQAESSPLQTVSKMVPEVVTNNDSQKSVILCVISGTYLVALGIRKLTTKHDNDT